tara:strand:+ start:1952 stop:3049 length:1098 start_codon:yes stop_codon:yes gene_type:complete
MFLIITRNFPPEVGGMQSLMGGLSETLLDHGPVKVFADENKNSESYDKISRLNIERVSGLKLFKKYRKANLVNTFINEKNNIRAIITDHWKSLELLREDILKKTVTFCLLHGKEINHKLGSNLNGRIIKSTSKANFIIANSNFTKNLAISIGINPKKIKVIHPGINIPEKIDNITKVEVENVFKDSFPKIITIARLDKRKGHDKILMVIKNLKNRFPKLKYLSIGDGEEEKNLLKLTKELSIDKDVTFLKNINNNLKLALLADANMFLMPSRVVNKSVEGFGIAFAEAASYGVGSIGGKDGGASDVILDKKTGLICDGNDLNSIYESTINFFKNENYIKYGANAKKFSENFYWKKIVKEYLKLIN